jgi:hypothetical protein
MLSIHLSGPNMKPNNVKRGVQLATHVRDVGSAPVIGRIGKIQGDLQGKFLSREQNLKLQQRRFIAICTSIGFGALALAVIGFAFVSWIRPILSRAKDTTERDRITGEGRVKKVSRFPSPSMEQALAIVRRALAVRDPAEVPAVIRSGATAPQQIVDYLAGLTAKDGAVEELVWLSNVDKNDLLLEGVQVVFNQAGKKRNRLAFLTPDDRGIWKMDFAAFARLVEPSWDHLLNQPAEVGVVRVYVGRDRYYNGPYADEKEWIVYGLGSEDLESTLYGYCHRGSPQHRAMELMVAADERSLIRATLTVKKADHAAPRQFEITRVLAEDWVLTDQAFDAMVK